MKVAHKKLNWLTKIKFVLLAVFLCTMILLVLRACSGLVKKPSRRQNSDCVETLWLRYGNFPLPLGVLPHSVEKGIPWHLLVRFLNANW